MEFDDIYWHDSIIRNIKIDRTNPGNSDTIYFEIDWYDKGDGALIFEDVYWANLNLNFGIIAPESILDANIGKETDADLVSFFSKWKGLLNGIALNCYIIDLNSTGGTIKIIAKGFKVV